MALAEAVGTNDDKRGAITGWIDQPIALHPEGKNLLTIRQLEADDIALYIDEALAADEVLRDPRRRGIKVAEFATMLALMKQPSTRTGGSMIAAMNKLGGHGILINDFSKTSEAKNETREDAWVAFAAQSDLLGIRTKEEDGPYNAASAIANAVLHGKLERGIRPVINLGNGTDEHPTQALGNMLAIYKKIKHFDGLIMGIWADHARYRAAHSDMLAAKRLGIKIIAIESDAAPVPDELVHELGAALERVKVEDMDEVMREVHILSLGRKPDEYTGNNATELARSKKLDEDYARCIVNRKRLQLMHPHAIVQHPRPRGIELHPDVDNDPRAQDVTQMELMIPARMGAIALHLGESIKNKLLRSVS